MSFIQVFQAQSGRGEGIHIYVRAEMRAALPRRKESTLTFLIRLINHGGGWL